MRPGLEQGLEGPLGDCANKHGQCSSMQTDVQNNTFWGNKPNIESTDYMEQSCSVLTRKGV